MSLTSLDPTADRLAALRELFPDAFAEGALDSDRLKALGLTNVRQEDELQSKKRRLS